MSNQNKPVAIVTPSFRSDNGCQNSTDRTEPKLQRHHHHQHHKLHPHQTVDRNADQVFADAAAASASSFSLPLSVCRTVPDSLPTNRPTTNLLSTSEHCRNVISIATIPARFSWQPEVSRLSCQPDVVAVKLGDISTDSDHVTFSRFVDDARCPNIVESEHRRSRHDARRSAVPPICDTDICASRSDSRELLLSDRCSYYYGAMTNSEAKARLKGCPVGTFLLRDSSDPAFVCSLSVKTSHGTTSIRIARTGSGRVRLDCDPQQEPKMRAFDSVCQLIDHYVRIGSQPIADDVQGPGEGARSGGGGASSGVFLECSKRSDTPLLLKTPLDRPETNQIIRDRPLTLIQPKSIPSHSDRPERTPLSLKQLCWLRLSVIPQSWYWYECYES